MPKKKKSERKTPLVAAERMQQVDGGSCPETWDLAPWIFPPGSIADVSSMLADFSKTQIEQAVALIEAGYVVGFSASCAELPMLAVEFGQACKVPLGCIWDDGNNTAYFGRLKDAMRPGKGRIMSTLREGRVRRRKADDARSAAHKVVNDLTDAQALEWARCADLQNVQAELKRGA